MKVGLFVNTQFPEGFNVTERVPEMIAQVHAAREAGFASLWFPHHWLTQPMQMLQITAVMGYVAAHAQGMTMGPQHPDTAAAQSSARRRGSSHAGCAQRR